LDFANRAQTKYGATPSPEIMEKIKDHVCDVIEGDSFNKTFGTVGASKRFNPSEAYVSHAERKGGRVIDAATVESGKAFMLENLKLRGVQWGNYVTDDERQHHLTKSAEALADLADVLGLPDEAISLGGKLGLAIGARGMGGARANYEPNTQVINLTRTMGVGSLAHEWGHGLDHYLGDFKAFTSESRKEEPIADAFYELRKAMSSSGFQDRLIKEVRNQGMGTASAAYWTSSVETFARTFERYVQDRLHEQGRENTYLVGLRKDGHPLWPTREEVAKMRPAMERLLNAVRAKHWPKVSELPAQDNPQQFAKECGYMSHGDLVRMAAHRGVPIDARDDRNAILRKLTAS
jgi:hypothetical protein